MHLQLGSDDFIIYGGGGLKLFFGNYFFSVDVKAFFFHTIWSQIFFSQRIESQIFFLKLCLVDSCFCPSVDPIDYLFCNISKQKNCFDIQVGRNNFFQPKAAPDYFLKKSSRTPPPIMKRSFPCNYKQELEHVNLQDWTGIDTFRLPFPRNWKSDFEIQQ